jgi:siderophore synthetase component
MAAELGEGQIARFHGTLAAQGLDPADYLLIPAHPWRWEHKLSVTFAGEIATRRLVPLGPGDDDYLAQQSVRTFFHATHPTRHYVKTALSVLNMGFMRGLSAAYMAGTPAINDWLAGLTAADPTFTAARFSIIRERATVGYHHLGYEAATAPGSPYRMMLAALWRESPVAGLAPGESLSTMAALLHTDADGGSFAAALIERSGLAPARRLRGYLDAYLVPVLHSLYAYGLAYMPHGENVILVLGADGGTVERVVFKDIAEEIVVMDPGMPLPPQAERRRAVAPEGERVLAVFTDVFGCFFRFLGAVLHTRCVLDQAVFWRTVAECVADYQDAHPELAAEFTRTTFSLRISRCPASTGCSCATTSSWWTWPIRRPPCSSPAPSPIHCRRTAQHDPVSPASPFWPFLTCLPARNRAGFLQSEDHRTSINGCSNAGPPTKT